MPSACASPTPSEQAPTEPFPISSSWSSSNDGSIEDNALPGIRPRSRRSTGGRSILQEIAQDEKHRRQLNGDSIPNSEVSLVPCIENPKRTTKYPRLRTSLAGFTVAEEYAVESALLSAREVQKKRGGLTSPRLTSSPIRIPLHIPGPLEPPRANSNSVGKLASDRRSRRTTTASDNSWSPAGAFLSQWNRTSDLSTVEPDEEGQEIGDDTKYIIGRQIGFGGFSVIKEAFSIGEDGRKIKWAVKIVRKQVDGKTNHENDIFQLNLEHERSIWKTLNNPYILSLMDVYEDSFATYCITHLHPGGTLHDLVRSLRRSMSSSSVQSIATHDPVAKPRRLSLVTKKRYIYELASALRYLHHDMQMVHRDVKLENCLINTTLSQNNVAGSVLLADFGMADYADSGASATYLFRSASESASSPTSPQRNQAAGSLQYAAPEILEHRAPDCFAPCVDIWAFGVVCYALLTLKLPFDDDFQPRVQAMILKGEYDTEALRLGVYTTEDSSDDETSGAAQGIFPTRSQGYHWHMAEAEKALQLVAGCLRRDVRDRWDIRLVLDCNFLQGCAELYDKSY